MTVDDLVEIGQYLQSMGHGQKQIIVKINYGAGAHLASDTHINLTEWNGKEAIEINASPFLYPDRGTAIITYPISELDEAEEAEIRFARETAPTVGFVTSPCVIMGG